MENFSYIDINESGYRNIWRISWPVMISGLFHTVLSAADMFWIGKLGPDGVAAVAITGSVFWVLFSFGGIIQAATIAIISRAAGSNDEILFNLGISTSLFAAIILSVIISSLSILSAEWILNLFGLTDGVIKVGLPYMRIFFIGFFFITIQISIFSIFYGLGNSRLPMIITVTSLLINIILDPFFIFGWSFFPELGVKGAAVASVLSIFYSFIIACFLFRKRIKFNRFNLNLSIISSFLHIGIPAMLHTITRPVTGMIMYRVAAIFGTFTIAAFGIGGRVISFIFIFMNGLMVATQTLVGQYLGRINRLMAKRITFKTLKIGFLVQFISSLTFFIFARQIIYIFNSNPEVVTQGAEYLRLIAVSLISFPLIASFGAAHRGSGDTKPQMISAIVANWVTKIPLSIVLSFQMNMQARGIWLAIGISVIVESAIITFFFFRGGWINYKIKDRDKIDKI